MSGDIASVILFMMLRSLLGIGVVATVLGAPGLAQDSPSGFDLVAKIRDAYAAVGGYEDAGTLVRSTSETEAAGAGESYGFSIRRDEAGGFVFRLSSAQGGDREEVFWRREGKAYRYDSRRQRSWPVRSVEGELLPMLGEGSQDLLVAAGLLLGVEDALPEPLAASVEGETACPGGDSAELCWILSLGFPGGLESTLWVEQERFLLRQVRVRAEAGADLFVPGARGGEALVWTAVHHPRLADTVVASFSPPAPEEGTAQDRPGDRVTDAGEKPHEGEFGETVNVTLSTFRVRALRTDGSPVEGLKTEDFRVKVGRQRARVVAVDWVEAGKPFGSDLPPEVLAETGRMVEPPGQLMVLFVQAGLHRTRMRGHLRQVPRAMDLLGTLGPEDRVAVVSFDSHLKLLLDFTRDFDAVEESLADAIRFGKPAPRLRPGRYPSLARYFDAAEAKRIAGPEEALEFTGRALRPLLGEKTMVFIGWGLGEYADGGVRYGRDYDRAQAALLEARTSVFVLDISEADFHTLELGLQQVARDTGGTYERVFRRGTIATHRLARTLSGYYLVTFETVSDPKTGTLPPAEKVKIRLAQRRGELIVSPWQTGS